MKRAIELTLQTIVILVVLLVGMIVVLVFSLGGFGLMSGEFSEVAHKTGIGTRYAAGELVCFGTYSGNISEGYGPSGSGQKGECEDECEGRRPGCVCKFLKTVGTTNPIHYWKCVPE